MPLNIAEVTALVEPTRFRWWLAGGHTLEAHLDRTWRSHDDIDVGIIRADVSQLRDDALHVLETRGMREAWRRYWLPLFSEQQLTQALNAA